ncbi:MAG: FxsA family protein [Yoonia sp.]|uniref:FxsA family protein n=1 Tax=Yoonia sp. TaxID=2212373 RepID=UPI00273FE8AD|nr:FxsA family protein [Yoonia sp.]MDP5086705.1 FxsA family protein [Yoonia sp.]MDP5359285.1 FxsA family protein [Paracoccaceae bacterium]
MWLLIAFIAVPMIEIALFIQVGGFIGIWWTLLIVLTTAVAGSYLVRNQGLREIANLQRSFSELDDPTEPLANGAMILFAGALLLTPGFFTDTLGLALLVPGVRRAAFLWAKSKVKVQSFSMGDGPAQRPQGPRDRVIDAEFEDVTPNKDRPEGPSEWTRH